jgi:rhodanese-related sulfurtransferase
MTSDQLAGMLYDSLQQKIKTLPDDVIVYPAHGPGSACGKSIGKETVSTIGEQKKFNYALQEMSKTEFISKVTEGITAPPAYFFEDARINKSGYDPIEEVIRGNTKPLPLDDFEKAVSQGAIILDTRKADDFEKGFIPGSINIGLNGQFAVWVGTLIDIRKDLVLVTETGKEAETVLRLARVGYEKIAGYLNGGVNAYDKPLEKVHSITPEELESELVRGAIIVDVRKQSEWNIGHVKNALLIPLSDFPDNLSGLDKEKPYIVHCGGGYRSMTAISIMKQMGFKDLMNVYGGFGAIQNAGLKIVSEEMVA